MNLRSVSKLLLVSAFSAIFMATACNAQVDRSAANPDRPGLIQAAAKGGVTEGEFKGRPYLVHTAASVAPGKRAPLLIVLHGAYGSADFIDNALGMDPVADKYGFNVAYLNGTARVIAPRRKFWNLGQGCCGPASERSIDDVGYISDFINYMVKEHNADPGAIYMMGHSNGAMMTYTYACKRGGLKAIVAVSGPLPYESCSNGRGLRVLHIQGEADQHVPIAGGHGQNSLTKDSNFRSVAQTESAMRDSGADFQKMILKGVPHDVAAIRQNIDLPNVAAKFMFQK